MKKSILNIEGVQILNREQKTNIKAGDTSYLCYTGSGLLNALVDWVTGCEYE